MAIYTFEGRVLPERVSFSLQEELSGWGRTDAGAVPLTWKLSIRCSQIRFTLDSREPNTDVFTLRNGVQEAIRLVLDSYGYSKGWAFGLEITTCTDPEGRHHVFGVNIPCLEGPDVPRNLDFNEIVTVCSASQPFRLALADARSGMQDAGNSGFYCYRAIESLRHHFLREGERPYEDRAVHWQRLNDALNIRRTWTDPISRFRHPRAHGEMAGITDADRQMVFMRTWAVLDRFGVLVRDRIGRLPIEVFPVLE